MSLWSAAAALSSRPFAWTAYDDRAGCAARTSREHDGRVAVAERVAGVRVLQLHEHDELAGPRLLHLDVLRAVGAVEVGHPLLASGSAGSSRSASGLSVPEKTRT